MSAASGGRVRLRRAEPENEWLLFVGGRSLDSAGLGGTGTGINFTDVFDDLDGPMHRGIISNTRGPSTQRDLPTWGGSVTFDSDREWHFDLETVSPIGSLDFYTIALHEIGHALGLNGSWNQWQTHISGNQFTGEHAVSAYNADNDTVRTYLALEGAGDYHWSDGVYQSFIFAPGEPVRVGTSGDARQDLLLEPTANFSAVSRRFEVTNVDAHALVDVGWEILPSLDANGDGMVDGQDLNLACSRGDDVTSYFSALSSLPGDLDLDGQVQFSDFLAFSNNFGGEGRYTDGDVDCDGVVQFSDFLSLSGNFGNTANAHAVPEPNGTQLLIVAWCVLALGRLRPLVRSVL